MGITFSPLPVDGLNNAIWGLTHWHECEAIAVIHDNFLVGLGFTSSTHKPQDILEHFIHCLRLTHCSRDDHYIRAFMTSWTVDEMPITAYGTNFQHEVWKNLLTISHQQTLSYKDMAVKINRPSAYRAVGQAVGRNPIAGFIPCHRIMGASGKIGGFRWGTDVKQQLLKKESGRV